VQPIYKFSYGSVHFPNRLEKVCRQRGLNFADLSFDQQNALWAEAKKVEE